MERNAYIYGLIDPTTNQIRYIGKSLNPKSRLRRHIADRNLYDSHKDRWLRKLIESNIRPELIIIDKVLENEWQFWEVHYINYFKFIGCFLTNGTNGGDQPPSTKGRRHTEDSKKKMSDTKKSKPIPWLNNGKERTEKHKSNLSKSLKGRLSEKKGKNYKEIYGKEKSDILKRKLSESHKGIYLGKNHPMFGKKHSEEILNKIKEKRKQQKVLKIEQYNINGVLIKEWDSIKDILEKYNISRNNFNRIVKSNILYKECLWKKKRLKNIE
jgi:group I intron endonuclease